MTANHERRNASLNSPLPFNPSISLVVLTRNRAGELLRSLKHLSGLPDRPPIIVVDNGSTDGTAEQVARAFPEVKLVRCPKNLGAAGRNLGIAHVDTPYVAFCDDDCWWEGGALQLAAELFALHPRIAVFSAQVSVGPAADEDPTCKRMANSPLPSHGLPGPALAGFLAGACAMRTDCFLAAGGYCPELLIGAEESLLSLDLLEANWQIVYASELVVHHWPSSQRDAAARRLLLARNVLWIAWLRLPVSDAILASWRTLRQARREGVAARALFAALRRAAWVARHRRVVSARVAGLWRACSTLAA